MKYSKIGSFIVDTFINNKCVVAKQQGEQSELVGKSSESPKLLLYHTFYISFLKFYYVVLDKFCI